MATVTTSATGKRREVVAVIAAGGHGTRGRRSHKMKHNTERTGECGEGGAFSLVREGRQWLPIAVSRAGRENSNCC